MRRRDFLRTTVAGSSLGLSGCTDRLGSVAPGESDGSDRIGVTDRWLTDSEGNRVVLRGVSVVDPWWGVEHADERGRDYWETLRLATDSERGWHTRVLRVPILPRTVQNVGIETLAADYLDRVVEIAAEQDAYLIVDYQAVERYDTAAVDERVRSFWGTVASRYADEEHVLYELFSEPGEPASDSIETWRTWKEIAEPWVDLVRNDAPETPIIVGSPRWSSLTKYAAREPFEDDNLLYSAHIYPSWSRSDWEETFGDPALEVPVFVTEWGYTNGETDAAESYLIGTTDGWGSPFRQWLDGHTNVSWCATTFDSRRQPRMFDTDWDLLGGNDHPGELVKDWLAERREDHLVGSVDGGSKVGNTPGEPPRAPPNLRVERVWQRSADLAWDAAPDPDGDRIVQYRVTVDGEFPEILRGSDRHIEITGLEPNHTHDVAVTAVDEHGLESPPARTTIQTPDLHGPITTLPRVGATPRVDDASAWERDDPRPLTKQVWGEYAGSDLDAEWQGLWDDRALYVRVAVVDSTPNTDSGSVRQNDHIEVFVDLDDSNQFVYDGEDDLHLLVGRGDGRPIPGPNSAPIADSLTVDRAGSDEAWTALITVPWDAYEVTPEPGAHVGIDVQAVDDVDGGGVDAKFAWFSDSGESWENPREIPVARLGE